MTVAEAVKFARSQKKMTQAMLADAVGVDRVTIARIEGGDSGATAETLARLASVLGLSLDVLLRVGKGRKSA